jgi:hypothetical protein
MVLTEPLRHRIQAKYLARRRQYERTRKMGLDDSSIEERLLKEFDLVWNDKTQRVLIVPGKETLSELNKYLQNRYEITVSVSLIVDCFRREEISQEMVDLLNAIEDFRKQLPEDVL